MVETISPQSVNINQALATGGLTTTTPAATPTATSALDPNSLTDYLKSQNKATDLNSRGTLFTSLFGSATPYTGSAAQNSALLTKLKMGNTAPATDPKAISGSSSIGNNQQTSTALGAAANAVNPPPPGSATPTTPPPVVTASGSTPTGSIIPANQVQITSAAGVGPDGKTQQGYDAHGNLFAEQIGSDGSITGYSLISKGIQGPNNPFNPPDPSAPLTVSSFQQGSSPTTGTVTLSNGSTQNVTIPTGKTYASSTINASGDTVVTLNDGSTITVNKDPNIADVQSQAQTAKNLVTQQAADQQSVADQQYQQALADLQQKQANAIASATAQYNAANPYGSGSDKTTYLDNIQEQYQKEIDNLTASYNQNKLLSQDQINSSIAQIDQNLSTNINTYKAGVISTAQAGLKESVASIDGSQQFDPSNPTVLSMIQQAQIAYGTPSAPLSFDAASGIVQGYYQKANTAYSKTETGQALSQLKDLQSTITQDPSTLPQSTLDAGGQLMVNAGLANNIEDGANLFKASLTESYKVAEQTRKDNETIANNAQRLAIAEAQLANSTQKMSYADTKSMNEDLQTYIQNAIKKEPNYFANVKTQADLSNVMASLSGYTNGLASSAMIQSALAPYVGQMPAQIQKIVQQPNLFQKLFGGKTITQSELVPGTGGGSTSSSSTPTSGNVPAGYYQASDGLYYPK